MMVAGDTDAERNANGDVVKKQLAFYGSTPAYRGVLDLHGWGDVHPQLNLLSRSGEWDAMTNLIDDDMLNAFSVVAPEGDIARIVQERFGDVIDRFSIYGNEKLTNESVARIYSQLRNA
jgi:hypothetical protein